jgi:chemotaxis protein MotB
VTLDEHRRLQAANRNMSADKQATDQDLYDVRTANESLRTRVTGLERELGTANELVANLRKENELLDEMRKRSQAELERLAGGANLGDITISSQKLPEPLHSAVKQFADAHPSEVVYEAARGTVKWKADLLFPLGSDVVKDTSMDALRGFTDILKSPAASDFEVIIVGHTDNRPIVKPTTKAEHRTNWHLSAHRSISVAFALIKNGYGPERVGVMGFGEYRPAADNSSEAGASQNRRVDVYIVPRGTMGPATTRLTREREPMAVAPAANPTDK